MASDAMVPGDARSYAEAGGGKSVRLHYLDWLQVIAVLGVFIFHALFPFSDLAEWNIKSSERSIAATLYSFFFAPWGMPFFFLMAGVTSWFSLRRRTVSRFFRERVMQLLVPYFIGVIVLTPIQAYLELTHRGWWKEGSIVKLILSKEARTYFFTVRHPITAGPETFSQLGYHLWFVAYLFAFSLIALPLFSWLKQDSGQRFLSSLARLAKWRGALLLFVIPLTLFRFILQPFFSAYTGWSDFTFMLGFFISGHILMSDERFMRAIRRDWLLYLILGTGCALYFFSEAAGVPVLDWMGSPTTPGFYFTWAVFSINSWCWTMLMLSAGMRFMDTTNKWLRYSRPASFPFFWIHHPVTLFTAFYALQWQASLTIKMLFVGVGSFTITLALYELIIRRINPLRVLFAMKPLERS
jgi:hypothetical protein